MIDKSNTVIIPFDYESITRIKNNQASAKKNGKAAVTLNGETFYIDETGTRIK